MGLFSRFKTMISSNINAAISKAENPEKMLNQAVIDMNEQLIESKKSVAMAIADEKKLEREYNDQAAQAQDWERKAMLAVQAGKDDLAKEALLRKQDAENNAAEFKKQLDAQTASVEQLKVSLRGLQSKIEEAQRKKNLLVARAKRAEAQKKIQETVSKVGGDNSAFDAFDRMAAKVDELEAENEAQLELNDATSEDKSLEKQFAELENSSSSADQMLLDLKQKMKALPDNSN
jgi:phage shock protein A